MTKFLKAESGSAAIEAVALMAVVTLVVASLAGLLAPSIEAKACIFGCDHGPRAKWVANEFFGG